MSEPRTYPGGRPPDEDLPIHPLIAARWSPRAVDPRPVDPETLRILFHAARWAPSSFNEQPWRFLVATTDEPEWLERLRGYLNPGNAWALRAPVLLASAYRTTFTRGGGHNRVASRDLGAAEQNLFLEAYRQGLVMHQMAGFDHGRLKEELLPEGFEPGAMAVIGHPGSPDDLPDDLREKEGRPRVRKPLDEIVFGLEWDVPAGFL